MQNEDTAPLRLTDDQVAEVRTCLEVVNLELVGAVDGLSRRTPDNWSVEFQAKLAVDCPRCGAKATNGCRPLGTTHVERVALYAWAAVELADVKLAGMSAATSTGRGSLTVRKGTR